MLGHFVKFGTQGCGGNDEAIVRRVSAQVDRIQLGSLECSLSQAKTRFFSQLLVKNQSLAAHFNAL